MAASALVGINLPGEPRPDEIRANLRRFAEAGFDAVEVPLDMLPLIVRGERRDEYVRWLAKLLREYPLRSSAHIGGGVDLRDRANPGLHEKVVISSLEICRELGASPLVLHYEEQSKDLELEERFLDAHRRIAERARSLGVVVCIENIEVERVEPVVSFVRELASPAVGMCFDTGHAYLASRYFHFDFLAALRDALPLVRHMHLSDNTGDYEPLRLTNRPLYNALSKGQRFAFGRGDVHLPPFWGTSPLEEVFAATSRFGGVYVCECYSQYFEPFLPELRRRVGESVSRARS